MMGSGIQNMLGHDGISGRIGCNGWIRSLLHHKLLCSDTEAHSVRGRNKYVESFAQCYIYTRRADRAGSTLKIRQDFSGIIPELAPVASSVFVYKYVSDDCEAISGAFEANLVPFNSTFLYLPPCQNIF
jgi:hypothetical protein